MKKLTTLFILAAVFVSGLFANPKIPKTKDYLKVMNSLSSDDCLVYVNNSGQNVYKLIKEIDDCPTLWFINESYVTGIEIVFAINFKNEKTIDVFTDTYITSYDLEKEFAELRDSVINSGITPLIIEKEPNKVKKVFYQISY